MAFCFNSIAEFDIEDELVPSKRGTDQDDDEDGVDDDELSLDAIVAGITTDEAGTRSQSGRTRKRAKENGAEEIKVDVGDLSVTVDLPPLPDRQRRLSDLLSNVAGVPGHVISDPEVQNTEIRSLASCDSESIEESSLFFCFKSSFDDSIDGHDWIDEAVEMGAVAIIAERSMDVDHAALPVPVVVVENAQLALSSIAEEFYDKPVQRIKNSIGFIGTFGKTSVAWYVRGLLEQSGELVGMIGDSENAIGEARLTLDGNIWSPYNSREPEGGSGFGGEAEAEFGMGNADWDGNDGDYFDPNFAAERERAVPFGIIPYGARYEKPPTTPDELHMQKLLASLADRDASSVLLEIDPSFGAEERIRMFKSGCLDVIVFTNIDPEVAAEDPAGYDAYVERVSAVFENLKEGQVAVINLDDELGPMLMRLAEGGGAQVITYGFSNKQADVTPEKALSSLWTTELLVNTPVNKLEIIMPMIGRPVVLNILAAVAVGLARGIKLEDIVAGIEAVDIIPGRNELIDENQSFPVIVDSVSTPAALTRLVDDVNEAGSRRTILVIGCSEDTTREQRMALGTAAHKAADVVIFTNESPGLTSPEEIIADLVAGLPQDVLGRHVGTAYPWMQDHHRVPQWYQPWLVEFQSDVERYVIEDRCTAIRVGVGLAKARDCVIVAGRGDKDKVKYWDGIPMPRDEQTRRASREAAEKSEPGSDLWKEEFERWVHIDEYWDEMEASGEPIEPKTVDAWLSDRVECRNAAAMLKSTLDKLKDLDRTTLPWTRYPEERENYTFIQRLLRAAKNDFEMDRQTQNTFSASATDEARTFEDTNAGQDLEDDFDPEHYLDFDVDDEAFDSEIDEEDDDEVGDGELDDDILGVSGGKNTGFGRLD
jgi:UDP-N-acetylmuramyl tripeptide synthase